MNDTSPEVEERYREMIMALTPAERVGMACRMFTTARALAAAGIRDRFGDLPRAEFRRQMFLRFYGNDFPPEERDKIADAVAKAGESVDESSV